MAAHHEFFDGRLHVYKRENSRHWQCSTYLNGRNWRVSTKTDSFEHAKDFAEDWYLGLRGKHRAGQLKVGKTFREAASRFELEFEAITSGQRNPRYVQGHKDRLRVHLLPFFGDKVLTEITPGLVVEYRAKRAQDTSRNKRPPARSTLHQEIVCLRQVLKTANRNGWLPFMPDLSTPYKSSGKVVHRAWFSPDEYNALVEATRRRAQRPLNNRHRWACEQLHDYVLFMANTGLRPDEAARLEFRDVSIVRDADTDETILEIEVRGKRGVGWCKSLPGAVRPFKRLKARNGVSETSRLFPAKFCGRHLLNTILDELELKFDRDGNRRTAYSLRHTYICMRLMEGADIYQVAKNCRTSIEMIEKFYAAHIKTTLDASAINVRKPRRRRPLRKTAASLKPGSNRAPLPRRRRGRAA
ncbi:MAG: tyrosine-type recombinase/integrase [Xanthobacteraceae bacterium]|uniref:tyrosine-type recombinase/integrase n=1 Tax=Pseudolabrys sp. TaxID=1960880 RepID=UPI003D09E3D6